MIFGRHDWGKRKVGIKNGLKQVTYTAILQQTLLIITFGL